MRIPSSGFPTRSDTNRAVQSQKMGKGMIFWILKVEGYYHLCSWAVTAELTCTFVFANAKSRFSHDAAHIFLEKIYINVCSYCLF